MSTIRAGTTLTTALQTTGDTTGNIVLTPDSGVMTVNATGALTIPSGTTAQRPASPQNGQMRYNTTLSLPETYQNAVWTSFGTAAYPITILLCGGGGGGGNALNDYIVATYQGAAGGSGIVIIRYADTYPAATSTTGSPTITTAGGYRVYQWTTSGSITF